MTTLRAEPLRRRRWVPQLARRRASGAAHSAAQNMAWADSGDRAYARLVIRSGSRQADRHAPPNRSWPFAVVRRGPCKRGLALEGAGGLVGWWAVGPRRRVSGSARDRS